MSDGQDPAVVSVRGVSKTFPGVQALSEVDLDFAEGRVTAVMGENGAGKSTLMKIIAGLDSPNEGTISVAGTEVQHFHPHAMLTEHRIALVPQELALCLERSVAENISIGLEPLVALNQRKMRATAREMLGELHIQIDPDEMAGMLGIAEQQLVVIARSLAREANVLILDEPTAALTPYESEQLFELLERLRERGTTIIYVSHRLPEVFRLSEVIHVLRDGRATKTMETESASQQEVVQAMVGRELADTHLAEDLPQPEGAPLLAVRGLSGDSFTDVDFEVLPGEIVGIAGLPDSGRTEFLGTLFGARKASDGEIELGGDALKLRVPADGIRAGIAYVPAERRSEGIIPGMSVAENMIALDLDRVGRWGVISPRQAKKLAAERYKTFDVRGRIDGAIAGLSGGNQQKAILARSLSRSPRLLLLDEPTRGVDVGAKAEIYELIEQQARTGAAVVISSSDLPELLRACMRISIMYQGSLVANLDASAATEEAVLAAAAGLGVAG